MLYSITHCHCISVTLQIASILKLIPISSIEGSFASHWMVTSLCDTNPSRQEHAAQPEQFSILHLNTVSCILVPNKSLVRSNQSLLRCCCLRMETT